MKEIIIPLSKGKIFLFVLGSLLMAVIGGLMIFSDEGVITHIFGIITLILFGGSTLYFAAKIFDNKPGLVINDKGIVDNSSYIAPGLILWEDIKDMSSSDVVGQRFVTLVVKNPERIIKRHTGLKKLFMNVNKSTYGSPIHLSSITLKCSFEELESLLKKRFLFKKSK